MKAVSGELPGDEYGWAFEVKWDGMRVLAHVDGHPGAAPPIRLVSTNGKDATSSFPELWPLAEHIGGRSAVLDGEVVALAPAVEGGMPQPDFGRLQQRMHVASAAEARRRAADVPVTFLVFDLLHLDDTSLLTIPYGDRRRLLRELLPATPAWSMPTDWARTGTELRDLVEANGLEGVVAKRLDSTYQPGRRSPAWIKVKVRRHQEFVVGGWTEGDGDRSGAFGGLLLGVVDQPPEPGLPLELRYAGRVGSGFDGPELARLGAQLAELASSESPFGALPDGPKYRTAHFVRPELVVEVAFGEWTADGVLRHPSYLGQRVDKDPSDVRQEPMVGVPRQPDVP